MAYDLEEQEQLAALRAWWTTYGTRLIGLVVIVSLGTSGWFGWQTWQKRQSEQASALYMELVDAIAEKAPERAKTAGAQITAQFSGTAYTGMAALQLAKLNADAGDVAGAIAQLDVAVEKGRTEEVKALARLRKAGLLLDEKKYDDALKVLAETVPEAFTALMADRRGDVYREQGKKEEARKEYKSALEKFGPQDGTMRNLVQIKLDALGDA
jgi:predicted negative regulator of RcsB-dependent stress response